MRTKTRQLRSTHKNRNKHLNLKKKKIGGGGEGWCMWGCGEGTVGNKIGFGTLEEGMEEWGRKQKGTEREGRAGEKGRGVRIGKGNGGVGVMLGEWGK